MKRLSHDQVLTADRGRCCRAKSDVSLCLPCVVQIWHAIQSQVVTREKGQREEEDRREQGRLTLQTAAARHNATLEAALSIGVHDRPDMLASRSTYESALGTARLAEVSSNWYWCMM